MRLSCRFTDRYPGIWRGTFLSWLRPEDFGELVRLSEVDAYLACPDVQAQHRHRKLMESATTVARIHCTQCLPYGGYIVEGDRLQQEGLRDWDLHLGQKYWYSSERHQPTLAALVTLLEDHTRHPKVMRRQPSSRLRYLVLVRDGFRCVLCGTNAKHTTLHVDHITPWSKGGLTILRNLRTLCQPCNTGKAALTHEAPAP